MRQEHIIKILQEPVDIPDIVQERAQEAFAAIHQETQRQNRPEVPAGRRKSKKRLWLAAAAAAALVGTVSVGAAVYQRWWSKGLEETLHASEEQMQEMDGNGVSSAINQAVTDQGVTITAVQSIVDNYYAHLAFKVEGFDLPEGAEPAIENIEVTVDGEDKINWSGGFYNGIVRGTDGKNVYGNGNPLAYTEDGRLIEKYIQEDGSLEFNLILNHYKLEKGFLLDKPIHVKFSNLGIYEKKTDFTPITEGVWEFEWTLQGSDKMRECKMDIPLGESGAILKEVEISPISMRAVTEIPDGKYLIYGSAEKGVRPPCLNGVIMKDGTVYVDLYPGMGGSEGMPEGSGQHIVECALDRILDVNQVESLLFTKEKEFDLTDVSQDVQENFTESSLEERFYVVPLES